MTLLCWRWSLAHIGNLTNIRFFYVWHYKLILIFQLWFLCSSILSLIFPRSPRRSIWMTGPQHACPLRWSPSYSPILRCVIWFQHENYESTEVLFMRRWENFHSRGQISQARMVGCMVRNTYFKFTLKSHSTPLNVEWGLEIPLQSLGWGATSEGGSLADKLLELEVSNR